MYKRWMTFFLILIFTPIHLSIADKVMRTNSLALSIIFTLVEIAIFFYVGRKYDLFHIRKISLKDMLKWLLSYALLFLFYMLVNFLGPTQSDTTQSIQSLSLSLPVLFLDLCILAPVTEEIFMRGLLQGTVFKNTYIGLVGTSVLFAYLHGPYTIPSFITYLGMGVAFGIRYKTSDNLWNSILLHFLNNLVAFCFMYFR
ncbi:CPBP family intramembrane glutamic endopeptidase [Streptococcus sp. oral taxon 431]|uniref:CPBP family intramembrane glutamic endopeptidase n=1 Tax=Streptococcus TaxID=1301 RepID=UPI002002C2C4|nr:CPBP family intramembrane glutamic endopeptidase [Streptococcus sp. oral taxon 431]